MPKNRRCEGEDLTGQIMKVIGCKGTVSREDSGHPE